MTSEDGTYVYAAPFPDISGKGYPNQGFMASDTIAFPAEAAPVSDLQMQVEELTRQNHILMEALRYCIANFSAEELQNDLRLGLIEMASKLK